MRNFAITKTVYKSLAETFDHAYIYTCPLSFSLRERLPDIVLSLSTTIRLVSLSFSVSLIWDIQRLYCSAFYYLRPSSLISVDTGIINKFNFSAFFFFFYCGFMSFFISSVSIILF